MVAGGLAVGGLGVHAQVPGTRLVADLALSWALAAAAIVVLERPRWHRASWLLAATAFAVLGADLEWASSNALWTLGFLLEGLWVALLALLVLTFPEGRSWSRAVRSRCPRLRSDARRAVVGAFVVPDARGLTSVLSTRASVAHGVDRVQEISGLPSLWSCFSSSCSGWGPYAGRHAAS
jgi:hypothetical protein